MKGIVSAALVALPLAFASQGAFAAPFSFTSTGTFTSPSGATINNNGSTVDWPGINGNHSYMAAGNFVGDFSGATNVQPGSHIEIGSLDWFNAEQDNSQTNVGFTYGLKITFTSPAPGGTSTETFNLSVTNTANNAHVCGWFGCSNTGDVDDTTSGFSGTALHIDGYTLSGFSFSVLSGGSFDSTTGTWSNPEGNESILRIYANVTQDPVATPEPMSLALLGTGLGGVGLIRRTRKNRA